MSWLRRLWHLYLDYMKSAVLAMAWTAVMLTVYGLIRTSSVAAIVASALLACALSLVAALLFMDRISPSSYLRRILAALGGLLLRGARAR